MSWDEIWDIVWMGLGAIIFFVIVPPIIEGIWNDYKKRRKL